MVTLHEVITFLVSMQISISSLQTHNVNRCGRSRHLARKLSLRRKRSSPNVFEMAATETIRSEERFSRNAETDLVCRLLLEKKKQVSFKCRHRVHAQPAARNATLSGVEAVRGLEVPALLRHYNTTLYARGAWLR